MPGDETPLLFKVLVVGDYAVGKTSLIRKYCTGEFTSNYRITIGVDFCVKTVEGYGPSQRTVSLQLWDIAGHERFGAMTRVYYKFAIAAVVVFDLTRPSTLDSARQWRQDIVDKVGLPDGTPIPMILLANKADVDDVEVPSERLDAFVQEHGMLGWLATSARTGAGVAEAFAQLIDGIVAASDRLQIPTGPPGRAASSVALDRAPSTSAQPKQCCS